TRATRPRRRPMARHGELVAPRRLRRPWLLASALGAVVATMGLGWPALDLFTEHPRVINHGPRERSEIALTFDADMTQAMAAPWKSEQVQSGYDAAIVRELQETRTPATIFVTGLWAMTYPDVVRLLAGDPLFQIENHSVDHAAFTTDCFNLPVVPSE